VGEGAPAAHRHKLRHAPEVALDALVPHGSETDALQIVAEVLCGDVGLGGRRVGFVELAEYDGLFGLDDDHSVRAMLEDDEVVVGAGGHELGSGDFGACRKEITRGSEAGDDVLDFVSWQSKLGMASPLHTI